MQVELAKISYMRTLFNISFRPCSCSQNFKLFGFSIFPFWAYLMKVIVKTCLQVDIC